MANVATKHGGPIDPYSPYSLQDFVISNPPEPDYENGDMPTIEYEGFHIMHLGDGDCQVQYDGHAGIVKRYNTDGYNDVLELVSDLNRLVSRRNEYDYQDDKEGLVEWAGKIMTSDVERAEENPDLYIHIPDEPFAHRKDDE